MIKALFLIFEPVSAWGRIFTARRSVGYILGFYLLPMLVLVAVAGGYGLVTGGKWQTEIGQFKKFNVNEAVVYQAAGLLLMLAVIAVCAHFIRLLGETFHGRHTYAQSFAVVAYGLSPMFLLRLFDALPAVNLWLLWVLGMMLVGHVLYYGVPIIMRPEPAHALGLYFMSILIIAAATGLERLALYLAWSGHSQPLESFFFNLSTHLPFDK